MREVALFVEDYAHQQVIGALVQRIAVECNIAVRLNWRSAVGGHGKVIAEFNDYLRDLKRQRSPSPDLIIVATDANCKGLNERRKEIGPRVVNMTRLRGGAGAGGAAGVKKRDIQWPERMY